MLILTLNNTDLSLSRESVTKTLNSEHRLSVAVTDSVMKCDCIFVEIKALNFKIKFRGQFKTSVKFMN